MSDMVTSKYLTSIEEPINILITSHVRSDLLIYFLIQNKEGSIRGIAKFLGKNPMQIRLELLKLKKAGILTLKEIGNQKFFSLNPFCTFLDELRGLLIKTSGYDLKIKDIISNINKIEIAFIYGSYVTGGFSAKSDLDIFILGEPDLNILNKKIHEVEKQINREINYVVMPRKEFEVKKKYGFVKNILKNKKIFLIGVI